MMIEHIPDAEAPAGDDAGWRERALCAQVGPEVFFPEPGGSTREAKRICCACHEREECLRYALSHDERFGVWGGLSENERRDLRPGGKAQTGTRDGTLHQARPSGSGTRAARPRGNGFGRTGASA